MPTSLIQGGDKKAQAACSALNSDGAGRNCSIDYQLATGTSSPVTLLDTRTEDIAMRDGHGRKLSEDENENVKATMKPTQDVSL
jgi:hypothetical protein